MKTAPLLLLAGTLSLACLPALPAAQVYLVRNSVKSGGATVGQGSSLASGSSLSTGTQSKTQLSLGNGSLARAGSKTDLILQNDSTLSLRQGVMLASSGKRTFGRDAVSVETPEIKASVKGTMLVAYQPDVFIKITCIEGGVSVKLRALMGEFVKLKAGQMIIINPAGKQLPELVEVDLQELCATSTLLGSDFPQLGVSPGLERAASRQAKGIADGEVLRTALQLGGAGLEVTLQTGLGVESRRGVDAPLENPPPGSGPNPNRGGGAAGPGPAEVAVPPVPEYIIDGSTVFPQGTSLQTPGFPLVSGVTRGGDFPAVVYNFGNLDPVASPELLFRGATVVPADGESYPIEFHADGNLNVGDGSPTSILWSGALYFAASGDLTLASTRIAPLESGSPLFQSTGLLFDAGGRIAVTASDISHQGGVGFSAPHISLATTMVKSGSGGQTTSAGRGRIELTSAGTSAANGSITITDSSNLQALAFSSSILINTNGAPISIRDSRMAASTIDLSTNNSSMDGLIGIQNSILSGDIIRARAYNTGDRDAILIRGSTFDASQLIQFYAEGTSKLRFQGDNRLNLGTNGVANLAGRIVEVDNGGNVTISGNANIYREVDNYNKAGFGNINISGNQSHQPFSARP